MEQQISFRELKKKMTEEMVKKNLADGTTQKILQRITTLDPERSSSSSITFNPMDDDSIGDESTFDQGDLFVIIRRDNVKEMLINGNMVANPKALRSTLEKSSSSHSFSERVMHDDSKASIGSQADVGLGEKNQSPPMRAEGGEVIEKIIIKDRCSSEDESSKSSKESGAGTDSGSESEGKGYTAGTGYVSSSPSSKRSSSSLYTDEKDELKKAILKYGEVGPKRLTETPENRQKIRNPKFFNGPVKPVIAAAVTSFNLHSKNLSPTSKSSALTLISPEPGQNRSRNKPPLIPSMTLKPQNLLQINKANAKQGKPKNFLTCVGNKSFISKGIKIDKTSNFQYHLSDAESKVFDVTNTRPMKDVSENEKKILKDGLRTQYLDVRREKSPEAKYHYPEATSWRYGWLVDGKKESRS